MSKELVLFCQSDGKWAVYDNTYDITIHCESKQEQDETLAMLCKAIASAGEVMGPEEKPNPWENDMMDTMWAFMQMGGLKADYPALKEACMELRQMMMQKTAGQRKDKPKDLSWDNLERVKVTIICEAMALVLSGEYEEAGA